jgi:hypothetical protein
MEDLQKELEDTKKLLELYQRIVRNAFLSDKFPGIYFICGFMGQTDDNGLPDKLLICPTYGVDWSQVYTKSEKTAGPEW